MKIPATFPASAMILLSFAAAPAFAAEIWSESFDSIDVAKIGFNNGSAGRYSFEDYSAMSVTSPNPAVAPLLHNIPEAPHRLAGSAPTRGLLMQVAYETVTLNDPDPPTITATDATNRIINAVALTEKDGPRLALTDNYRLKFDFYLRLSPNVTFNAANGLPNEAGTTEQMLWGVGYNAVAPMARGWRTNRGNGMWGWLSTEGGHGPTVGSDAALYRNGLLVGGRNLNKAAGVNLPDVGTYFYPAFGAASSPMPGAPANQWCQGVITVSGGLVTVEFKGEGVAGTTLTKFHANEDGTNAISGSVMVGYEDSFASKSFAETNQWMLLDNMTVEEIPPPTILVRAGVPLVTFTGSPQDGSWNITNNQEVNDLTISSVIIAGTNASDFTVLTPMPLVIPHGTSVPLVVRFNPGGTDGIKNATLSLISNDPQLPAYPPIPLRARRSIGTFFAGHFKLDETTGASAANAAGGAAGTFQVRNPLVFAKPSLTGGTGTSIGFLPAQSSTTGNYLTAALTHTPSYTVSMWIKPESTGADRTLFQRDQDFAAPTDGFYALLLKADGTLTYRVNGSDLISAGQPLVDGEVHHIAVTHLDKDGFGNDTADRARIYVDGLIVAEVTGSDAKGFLDYSLAPAIDGLHIGSRTTAGNGYQGDMDDIQLYGRELSAEQIWSLFRQPGITGSSAATFKLTNSSFVPGGDNGTLNLTWQSNPSVTYSISTSANLSDWSPPGVLTVPGAANADTTTAAIPLPGTGTPRLYYRVVSP
jgi:hypothetical protein